MGTQCQEELPPSKVPQLATCFERLPDHVHCPQDWQDGEVHGGHGGVRSAGSLLVS